MFVELREVPVCVVVGDIHIYDSSSSSSIIYMTILCDVYNTRRWTTEDSEVGDYGDLSHHYHQSSHASGGGVCLDSRKKKITENKIFCTKCTDIPHLRNDIVVRWQELSGRNVRL